jgi:hypothetical protein
VKGDVLESDHVGYELISVLKTVKLLSELALNDVEQSRDTQDHSKFLHAADCLREMQELIGGYKLPLMIAAFERRGATRRGKNDEL